MSLVHSVNVAVSGGVIPGSSTLSGIRKQPTGDAVQVCAPGPKGSGGSGLVGDLVCDLRHHGGNDQAVYAYAREDLDWWHRELGRELPDGSFGENLTTSGLNVSQAIVGEHWLIGGAVLLQVTVPRIPCSKFAAVIGAQQWVKRFTQRAAPGTYLRVLRPGRLRAGDSIVVVERPEHQVTVATAFRAITTEPDLLDQLVGLPNLPDELRATVDQRVSVAG